jgi:hypothetical protein
MAKKKIVQLLSERARLAQERISREVKLPKEVSKVSFVYHTHSNSNKPLRNMVKYKFDSLSGANPHTTFQKIVYRDVVPSNDNFITVEMIDGTQRKVMFKKKELDAEKNARTLLQKCQELVPSVDTNVAKFLKAYAERIRNAKLAAQSAE